MDKSEQTQHAGRLQLSEPRWQENNWKENAEQCTAEKTKDKKDAETLRTRYYEKEKRDLKKN